VSALFSDHQPGESQAQTGTTDPGCDKRPILQQI
jgi:hypothetical protein